jgi:hypothetical protein
MAWSAPELQYRVTAERDGYVVATARSAGRWPNAWNIHVVLTEPVP